MKQFGETLVSRSTQFPYAGLGNVQPCLMPQNNKRKTTKNAN